MGRWRYMAEAASYGLVYPCGWQYYMLFVYVWLRFSMREFGAVTLSLSLLLVLIKGTCCMSA